MGIPKFFRYITDKYPNIITGEHTYIDNLFFDLNCLIHPCAQKVIKNHPDLVIKYNIKTPTLENISEFEKEVYKEIGTYLKYLIDFAKPQKLIYLAIDGVAPRSKMEQQRSRRYRSIMEKQMRKKIDHKFNKKNPIFDTNCITPGTIFMKKLSMFLKSFLLENKKVFGTLIILDDSGLVGEGEHKILQYMKENCITDSNCVYGLDADLIMLNIVNGCETCYLLREAIHYGKVDMETLLYFNVSLFGEKLFKSISTPLLDKYYLLNSEVDELEDLELIKDYILKDYVCLCFLIGNDFLPHLPGIDINNKSLDMLIEIYSDIFTIRTKYLINEDNTINFIFLKQIIMILYDMETNILNKYQKKKDRFRPRLKYKNTHELELEKLKFYPIFNKDTSFKYTDIDWRDKYYNYYFHFNNYHKNKPTVISICQNYIDGLQWNAYYYFDKCVSYSWYYKYMAAPTFKDLATYFINRTYPPSFTNIMFTPLEQLSIVLPKESGNLWCKAYRELVDNDASVSIHYPKKYRLDLINKIYLHECEPMLCDISNEFIKDIFSNISLTNQEKKLNERTELVIYK